MSPILNARLPHASPAERPAKKVPLHSQLLHAERELRLIRMHDKTGERRPRLTAKDAEYIEERQSAIVETLRWISGLDRNAPIEFLKQREAAKPAAEGENS